MRKASSRADFGSKMALAGLAAATLALSPAAAEAAPEPGIWVRMCGDHPPMRLPTGRKGDMSQGCHAGCAATIEKRKRLGSNR